MANASSFNQLFKLIEDKIRETLKDDVRKESVKTMQKTIQEYVYNAYQSSADYPYQRKEYNGGLIDSKNILAKVTGTTLLVQNIRKDGNRYVALIVEQGYPYDWVNSEIYRLQPYPRPFTKITRTQLRDGGARKAMVRGLKRRGLTTK